MSIIFDDDDAADGFVLPPEAPYKVEITEAEERQGAKGAYMNVKLKILEGEHAGSFFYDVLMLTGRAAHMGRKKSAAFGVKLEKGTAVADSDYIGTRAVAHGIHEVYNNRTNLKVDINQGDFCGYDFIAGAKTEEPKKTGPGANDPDWDFGDVPF